VLAKIESLRTLDRLRLRTRLADPEVARSRATILQLLDSFELVDWMLWFSIALASRYPLNSAL
jgi:hypothetical protein